jgi:phage/plasmid primase-like uncharacterized protein
MVDLTRFHAGIEAALLSSPRHGLSDDPRGDFHHALRQAGYDPGADIVLGKITRIKDPHDKPAKKTGWYFYAEFEMGDYVIGVGSYGSWRTAEKHSWSSKAVGLMSFQESALYRERIEQAKYAQEAEQERVYAEAAQKAMDILATAQPCQSHPYLDKKQLKPVSKLMVLNDILVVPLQNHTGNIASLQRIWENGDKKNLTGGKMKGSFFLIEGDPSKVCICEGVATGMSIHAATKATVYCAMSAANIYETTSIARGRHEVADIVICADDNSANKINTGLNAATQAAQAFSVRVASPTVPKDFNDMHVAIGLEAVANHIFPTHRIYQPPKQEEHGDIIKPPGVLGQVFDFYRATSGNDNSGFAVQAALAIGSVVCARWYESNLKNRTSLYFLNLGETGTGKEHIKTVIEDVLMAAGMDRLIAGDGYTSAAAVLSAMMSKPRHVSIIDEFDKHIEAAKNKYGNSNMMEANSKLVEQWGRLTGVTRSKSYSTIGLTRDKAKDLEAMHVVNGGVTLVGMSTPDNFMRNMGHKEITDGFLNRFLIHISDVEEDIRRHKEPLPVPESITAWVKALEERRGAKPDIANQKPDVIRIHFSSKAHALQESYQYELIELKKNVKDMGLADMAKRANEMAMRIGVIMALSEDPMADVIEERHIEWGIYWTRFNLHRLIDKMKMIVAGSQHEASKKEILAAIRSASDKGVSWAAMQKRPPYSKYKQKELKEILQSLKDADLIIEEPFSGRGRPTMVYKAIE